MTDRTRLAPFLLAAGFLGLLAYVALGPPAQSVAPRTESPAGARYRLEPAEAERTGARPLTQAQRDATFRFDPAVAPHDRQAFLTAVAAARPEARRLIDLVDGVTFVRVGQTAVPASGTTQQRPDDYELVLDFGQIWQGLGQRGVNRLVLHELGHVVDMALLTDDVLAGLDAGVPAGWGCEQGVGGACAPPEERFAESFAKWAAGDIGVDLNLGYRVPPPIRPLDAWGEPLARLAAG